MAKVETLVGWNVNVSRGRELDEKGEQVPVWWLIYEEAQTGNQIRLGFREPVRDFLVKGLMSGIVLPTTNGDLSRLE